MNNDIDKNFIMQEIWEAARETYFDTRNTTETFEIERIFHDLRQGDLSNTQYFSLLTHY